MLRLRVTVLVATVLLSGCSDDPSDCLRYQWSIGPGSVDGPVLALAVIGDRLYAGGAFVDSGADTTNHIAYSMGGAFRGLGPGVTGDGPNVEVRALAEYAGDVIAGGFFSRAGAESVSNIARWDGDSWHALGGGLDGSVSALVVFDGNLVAGGGFDHAGDVTAHNIATWDGSAWAPLGSGTDGRVMVRSLCVFDGKLIVGGGFTSAGGVSANYVAEWDGTGWAPLGAGTNGPVHAMLVHTNSLIAGGEFTEAGGAPARAIAQWDGTSWRALGSGVGSEAGGGCVRALGVFNEGIVAGGTFVNAGQMTVNNLAVWYGVWSPVGDYDMGLDGDVYAVATLSNSLYVAGDFAVADGYAQTGHVAVWRELSICF